MSEARLRRANLTPEEKAQLKNMVELEGKTRVEAARALGVNPSVVTRHLGSARKYVRKEPEQISLGELDKQIQSE